MKFRYRRKDRPIPRLEPRIVGLAVVMALVLACLAGRLYYLQILQHHKLAQLADRNRIRIRRLPALRGLVFDRLHRPLVDTIPSFDAVVTPEDTQDLTGTIARLRKLLGEGNIAERIEQAEDQQRPAYEPITVEQNLDWRQVVALETHQLNLPGVGLQVTPRRHYPYDTLAAHLLGYVGEVTQKDLARLSGYQMNDEIGKFGVEHGWEKFLRGDAGDDEIEVDSVGRRLRLLREVPERPGDSVVLTIDLDLQQVAEQSLGDRAGALVAIDPNTGYILALVSHPAFNPNLFSAGITPAKWRQLMTDPEHPLEDRAIQGIYAPGSTFKIVDAIAGLEEHTLTTNTTYYCPGGLWYGNREYRCWRRQGHGEIQLHRAIVSSCDVFFYQVGIHLGIDRLAHWAHLLGLGRKTGIALANEATGIMPSSAWKERRYHQRWYPAETLSVAIGQGYVAVTPIQMAQLAAEVANGGIRYKPQFVREVDALDGSPVKTYPPMVEERIDISPQTLKAVRDAMCDVVNAPGGTGHKAALPNVLVCGKTGTAQIVREKQGVRVKENALPEQYRDNGWFIAFAPKDHPQIAIACIVEHSGHGGSSAAPVVRDVLQKYFALHPPQGQPPLIAPVPKPIHATPQRSLTRLGAPPRIASGQELNVDARN